MKCGISKALGCEKHLVKCIEWLDVRRQFERADKRRACEVAVAFYSAGNRRRPRLALNMCTEYNGVNVYIDSRIIDLEYLYMYKHLYNRVEYTHYSVW